MRKYLLIILYLSFSQFVLSALNVKKESIASNPVNMAGTLAAEVQQGLIGKGAETPATSSLTADYLQAQLNAIVRRGTATKESPETITIPASGVLVDNPIMVNSKCHAVITGGPIKITMKGYDHCAFSIWSDASLALENITFDCNNSNAVSDYFYVLNGGNLEIGGSVNFVNNELTNEPGLCYLENGSRFAYCSHSVFRSSGNIIHGYGDNSIEIYDATLESTSAVIDAPESHVSLIDGNIIGGGSHPVITAKDFTTGHWGSSDYILPPCLIKSTYTGISTIVDAKTAKYQDCTLTGDIIKVQESVEINGNIIMPTLLLDPGAVIYTNFITECIIDCTDWGLYPNGKTIVMFKPHPTPGGSFIYHSISPDEFSKLTFVNLPKGREAYLDDDGTVKLRSIVNDDDDLQKFIDGLVGNDDSGTEDNPAVVPLGPDGIDMNGDVNIHDDLQIMIDGLADESADKKEIRFNGGDMYISKRACLTLNNIFLNGCNGMNRIYVTGTLIINNSVEVHNFADKVIYVRPGGHVIWQGGVSICMAEVIYNDGGTVDIHGGSIGGIINGDVEHTTGTVHIYNGTTVWNDIINYGTLIVEGGTVISNTYAYNDIYVGGSARVSDAYLAKGVKVNVIGQLLNKIRIRFIIDRGFNVGEPIVIGTGGYALAETDIALIDVMLPSGYGWRYDQASGGIIIYSTTGIDDVNTDGSTVVSTYDITGRKTGEARKGINIERMSDGTVRKVVVK